MSDRARHEAIVALLKKRFPNLTVGEVNTLAWDILEAIEHPSLTWVKP